MSSCIIASGGVKLHGRDHLLALARRPKIPDKLRHKSVHGERERVLLRRKHLAGAQCTLSLAHTHT